MKKANKEMLSEYDFSDKKGVRGKYHKAYKEGHTVKIYKGKEIVSDVFFASIEEDVRKYFPDSKSINKALRSLIKLVPKKA